MPHVKRKRILVAEPTGDRGSERISFERTCMQAIPDSWTRYSLLCYLPAARSARSLAPELFDLLERAAFGLGYEAIRKDPSTNGADSVQPECPRRANFLQQR